MRRRRQRRRHEQRRHEHGRHELACGGDDSDGGTSSGGTNTGGTNTGGTSSGGTSSGGGSGSGGTSGGGAGGAGGAGGDGGVEKACTDFVNATSSPVKIRFMNNRTTPIYLGQTTAGCAVFGEYSLEDSANKPLKPVRDLCEFTCAELQTGSCACPAGCAAPYVTKIGPGGHYDVAWPGTVFESTNMPAKCFYDGTCAAAACYLEKLPPTGPLTVKASVYTQPSGCSGTCQDCTPGGVGNCILPNATTVTGTEVKAQATWTNQTTVQLDFN
ncbi:MAG: hypothetical protein U0263_33460 [Polyangiaceae bacterium]